MFRDKNLAQWLVGLFGLNGPEEPTGVGAAGSGDSDALLDALNDLGVDLQRAIEEAIEETVMSPLTWFLAFEDLGIECEEDPDWNVGKDSAAGGRDHVDL